MKEQVELHYTHLLSDLKGALEQEKSHVFQQMEALHEQNEKQASAYLKDNDHCGQALLALSKSCDGILAEKTKYAMLQNAPNLPTLVSQVSKRRKE